MPTQILSGVNPRYFLNRLALEHSADSLLLDPHTIIKQLFAARPFPAAHEMFEDFCEAAVAPAYCWKDTPGKLIAFAEALEQLIEACFLLRRSRAPIMAEHTKALQRFFSAYSLPEWKRILHEWTQAALSACSVAEIGKPCEMIPFVTGMEELLGTARMVIGQPA